MENFNAFLAINSQLKSVTTRKRIAKTVLGSKHPIVAELRAEQRALRNERAKLCPDIVLLGQAGSKADLVQAHGVDEGAYVEELMMAAAEGGEEA